MSWRLAAAGSLAALALAAASARAADPPHTAQDPNAGFLEFLGSVDRLSDLNPDYLSQVDPPKAAQTRPGAVRPVQTQPPPPPARPNPNPPGVNNNG